VSIKNHLIKDKDKIVFINWIKFWEFHVWHFAFLSVPTNRIFSHGAFDQDFIA